MSVTSEADQIEAILNGISDIGRVYDHHPTPPKNDFAEYVKMFMYDAIKRIRCVTIVYVGETRERKTIAFGSQKFWRRVNWKLRYYEGWAADGGDQERFFRDRLEEMANLLDTKVTLNGVVQDHTVVQVTTPNDAQGVDLGGVSCYYGELSFTTLNEETLATS